MGWISLKGITLNAPVGWYEKEREQGNNFEIDVSVWLETKNAGKSDDLEQTVDYQALYDIVNEIMDRPAKLIEHKGHVIAETIIERYPLVETVKISISKINPPIQGQCQRAVFELEVGR